jgi:hypothetical protein
MNSEHMEGVPDDLITSEHKKPLSFETMNWRTMGLEVYDAEYVEGHCREI